MGKAIQDGETKTQLDVPPGNDGDGTGAADQGHRDALPLARGHRDETAA